MIVAEFQYLPNADLETGQIITIQDTRLLVEPLRNTDVYTPQIPINPEASFSNGIFLWNPPIVIGGKDANIASPVFQRDCWSILSINTGETVINKDNRYIVNIQSDGCIQDISSHQTTVLPITDYSKNISIFLPNGVRFESELTRRDRNNQSTEESCQQFSEVTVGDKSLSDAPVISIDTDNAFNISRVKARADYSGSPLTGLPESFIQIWVKDGDENIVLSSNDEFPTFELGVNPQLSDNTIIPTRNLPVPSSSTHMHVASRIVFPGQICSDLETKVFKRGDFPFSLTNWALDFNNYVPPAGIGDPDAWNEYDNIASPSTNGQDFYLDALNASYPIGVHTPVDGGVLTKAVLYNYYETGVASYARLVIKTVSADDFALDFQTPTVGNAPTTSTWLGTLDVTEFDMLRFYVIEDPNHAPGPTKIKFRGRLVLYITKE
jgi:hypothetical protein